MCKTHCRISQREKARLIQTTIKRRERKESKCIMSSSSSSYRAGRTDIPDPLSPLLPIVHRPR